MITNSRDELFSLRSELQFSCRSTQEVYNLFPELSLTQSRSYNWIETSEQPIKARIKNRKKLHPKSTRSVNSNNLININTGCTDLIHNTITVVVDVFQRRKKFSQSNRLPIYTSLKLTSSYDISNCLNFTLWNARSLGCKTDSLCASIVSNHTDVCLISESWITEKNESFVNVCFTSSISGFSVHQVPRCRRKGSGLAMLIRSNLKVKKNNPGTYTSMEVIDYNIYCGKDLLHVVLIYRPPYSKSHKVTVKMFLSEFGSLMESAMTSAGRLIVTGDLNIHVDDMTNIDARQFTSLYTSLGLTQHVVGPTHSKGHTLDLVFTRAEDLCVTNIVIDRSLPSDHAGVHFSSNVHRPPLTKICKQHRSLIDLDITSLKDSIALTLSDQNANYDVNTITEQYNSALNLAIEEHAPIRLKSVVVKPRARWLTMELIEE
ncbi:hypothetical protein SNE40_002906 [Patella caerulea]|uniref:Endonuclease/exonuclease/phosphatase domain-containing protein n=1 Tax=Patella caerulea TaxID=87958 RepID=A0AAN8K716_PATCE